MKTKRSESKLALVLNKKTIANLNRQEMVKVKGLLNFEQIDLETYFASCCTPIDTDAFKLSIIRNNCN